MKLEYSHGYERTCAAYGKFQSLWKTDDPEWLAQRKAAWRHKVEQEGSVPLTKFLGEYYVYGKEPATYIESDTGELSTIGFRFSHRIAYTPFENAEQLIDFWRTTVDYAKGAAERAHAYVRYAAGWLEHLPERDEKVRFLIEILFTPDYFMNTVEIAGEEKLITISPRDFIAGYAQLSSFYRKKNQHIPWDYRNFTFEYFMLCVQYCDQHPEIIQATELDRDVADMYETLLELNDANLDHYRLELKQQLMDAAQGPDASGLLKEALQTAKENLED